MKRMSTSVILATLALLSGCVQQTSPERHARSYVLKSSDDFDPNFRTHVYNTVQLSLPMFQHYHEQGKADKAAGLSQAQAEQRMAYFSSETFFHSLQRSTIYAGRSYSEEQTKKWRNALSQEAAAAYLDGYQGRQ